MFQVERSQFVWVLLGWQPFLAKSLQIIDFGTASFLKCDLRKILCFSTSISTIVSLDFCSSLTLDLIYFSIKKPWLINTEDFILTDFF